MRTRYGKLYNVWIDMKRRCRNHTRHDYYLYGGRGISVCPEWSTWAAFEQWAKQAGYAEGLSLDRIDNSRDYAPENCRWITVKEQSRNRRSNRPVRRSDGKIYPTMVAAAEDNGAQKTAIYAVCQGRGKTAKGFGWQYI
jgi:hypothetical protein